MSSLVKTWSPAALRDVRRSTEAQLVTWLIVGLIVWLPLQTPLAIALYQYGGLSVSAVRALVLAKDVIVPVAGFVLFIRHFRDLRWHWFDLSAILFLILLAIYSVVPLLSRDGPSLNATIAGLRQFVLPIEIYVFGRLAAASGVRFGTVLRPFLVVAVAAALFTVAMYVLVPVSFWTSTLDLVRYVRDVQGLPYANSLWDISVVGDYGQESGALIARAIGPFTHPVGTAAYFVLPLALSVSALFASARPQMRPVVWALMGLLFLVAIIFTISRGSWIAAVLVILLCGVSLRQARLALLVVAAFALVVFVVPPFNVSLQSALTGTDGSAALHQQAVEQGVQTVGQNPLGIGVARSDYQFGQTFGGGAGEGALLENTYLSIFVGAGPFGLITFLGWLAGIVVVFWPGRDSLRYHWPWVAVGAAMIGLAIASLTASTLMRFTTAASVWILVGLLVGHLPQSRAFRSKRASSSAGQQGTAGAASM